MANRGYPDTRAFPSPHVKGDTGLSVFQYTAVAAMQGILAGTHHLSNSQIDYKQLAERAVKTAEAMCLAMYDAEHTVQPSDLPPPDDGPMVLGKKARR